MKKLLLVLGVLVALVVVVYFVVTSSGFLRSVVLPRVGAQINARVDAESIAVHPFSRVEIRKLLVIPNGAEQLASVDLVRLRYRLFDILGGRIVVDEVYVGTPSIALVQNADGTSNLDPILKKLAESGAKPATPAPAPGQPSQPVQLDLKSLKIENATFTYRSTAKDGARMDGGVSGLNVELRDIRNGGTGRLEIASNLAFDQRGAGANPTNSGLQGTVKGGFDLGLTQDLMPATASGSLEAQLQQARGAFQDFQGFASAISVDLAANELKNLAVDFRRQGTALGSIAAKGPLDLTKKEARLQVDVQAIDRNVLNLFGAAQGIDFTTTRFDSANRIEIGAGGQAIGLVGSLTGTRVSLKQGDLTMPAVDLKKTYDVTVDLAGEMATVKAFSLTGNQGGREVLRGTLASPMQIRWAANAGALPDAALDLLVNDLRLADWSALAGTPWNGAFRAQARFGVQGGGKDLGFDLSAGLTGFSGTFGSNVVKNLGFAANAKGVVVAFADAARRRLSLAADVNDLSGEAAAVKFDRYGVGARADIGLPEGAVALDAVEFRFREGTREGGSLTVKGRWDTVRSAGDLALGVQDVNESGLRPFLQPALGDKQLRTVRVVADVTTRLDPAGESAVKASALVTNLVVRDPAGTVPEAPLAVGLALDASGTSQKLVLRQAQVGLAPTARAKNVAGLTGDLDFSKADALRGALKLTAESIDVTPYYDLFTESQPASGQPAPKPAPTPSPSPGGPQTEPEAVKLPIERLTFDASIGKFFLREVAAENFVAAVRIENNRIDVQPLQLSLNGAPIQAGMKLNLGVPGYEYDVKLTADRIPVQPFANSFVPSLKDRIGGGINAGVDIQGAGVTGTSLQKSLNGGLSFAVTNANLSLTPAGNQKPGILTMLARLLAGALNIRELQDQPIMEIAATAKMGGGRIDLTQAQARSASLDISSGGSIPIAADLMQSPLNFPVQVGLFRELAVRSRLASTNTPATNAYVTLPAIASLKGTLGAPSPEVDKVQVGLLLARGIAGLAGSSLGGAAGSVAGMVGDVLGGKPNAVTNLVQGIGGLFGGKPAASTATNAAGAAPSPAKSTNAAPSSPVGGLIRGLGGLLGGGGGTPAPAPAQAPAAPASTPTPPPAPAPAGTGTPTPSATPSTNPPPAAPATNAPPADPVGSLIKGILGPRKSSQ